MFQVGLCEWLLRLQILPVLHKHHTYHIVLYLFTKTDNCQDKKQASSENLHATLHFFREHYIEEYH